MFAITPKYDCPHLCEEDFSSALEAFTVEHLNSPCEQCHSQEENWYCFTCQSVFCSRFVEGHMVEHNDQSKHPVAFSFSDGSAWCYECDSYIYSDNIRQFSNKFQSIKFHVDSPSSNDHDQSFTREQLIAGLRSKQFRKVAVLTGAGISVAAGIPDFRTPGTGLYSKIAKFGLPYPEMVFDIRFFESNPYPFYQVAKEFLTYAAKPVTAHHFIRKLFEEDILFLNYTQNIDGLELEAGLPAEKLVQAHGHMRSAHCLDCSKKFDEMSEFYRCIEEDRLWLCADCNPEAHDPKLLKGALDDNIDGSVPKTFKGLIKPDVVFFGEPLPFAFHDQFHAIKSSDLVIVMGTSLKVYPFALLLEFLPDNIPVVLINRENPGISRDRFLFLSGDIEETVKGILSDCEWEISKSLGKKDN